MDLQIQSVNDLYVDANPKIAYVPITAYNTCGDRIKHLSCLLTIITPSSKIPALAELHDDLCDYTLKEMNVEVTDNAHIDVCLQVGDIVGGIVYPETKNEERKSPSSQHTSSRLAEESSPFRISSMVKVDEIDSILPSLVDDVTGIRKVPRSVIISESSYYLRSKEQEMIRGKGSNVGNFIWQYGVARLYNPFTTVSIDVSDKAGQRESKENFGAEPTAFIIGEANLFYVGTNEKSSEGLDDYNHNKASRVNNINLPTIVLGAGVQIDFSEMSVEELMQKDILHDAHKELLTALLEHAKGSYSLGARGEITESLCKNANFGNCISLGCPSLLLNRSLDLGHDLMSKWERTISKLKKKENIRIGLVYPVGSEEVKKLQPVFQKIYESYLDVYFISQTPEDEMYAAEIAHKTHLRKFLHMEDWGEFTSGLDIVISTRIHGSMASIMGGTPAVVIPTDFRILELVNSMKMPTLSVEQLVEANAEDLLNVLELVKPDFDVFERNRREKISKYVEMFNAYNLEIDPQLLAVHEQN